MQKWVIGIAVYTAYTVDSQVCAVHLVTEYTEATVINELSTTYYIGLTLCIPYN